ncbi:hypothetical protein FF38_08027 [Lucilia cuprina]|uniref:Uncharacterized protein n=1 Tax=Lucilia cuprina TaxID=7375 RepID=A0A0L0BUG0_LUCCU|nr:uncharacterized protein LOC111688836 [Lucilia cuprina]KAI8125302.1 hypothetical protein CVS40_4302 [Lucilia cuprina]KNC22844.1 hypothetical protein FF38_08027 [Lucilia cuprina]
MNFKFSTTIFIILIAIGLEVISAQSTQYSAYINNKEDERKIIGQFYNYVDIIMNIKLDNMLKMTQEFTDTLLDSIPLGERGNTAELLYQYRMNSQRLREQGGSIEDKENLLMELQQLIATIKSGLAKQEKEDIILRRGLLGMFELLARLSIEERKCNNRFSKAATVLRQRFTEEGIERHRELFDLLQELNDEHNIVQREKLFARFKELKANEI